MKQHNWYLAYWNPLVFLLLDMLPKRLLVFSLWYYGRSQCNPLIIMHERKWYVSYYKALVLPTYLIKSGMLDLETKTMYAKTQSCRIIDWQTCTHTRSRLHIQYKLYTSHRSYLQNEHFGAKSHFISHYSFPWLPQWKSLACGEARRVLLLLLWRLLLCRGLVLGGFCVVVVASAAGVVTVFKSTGAFVTSQPR